MIEDIDDIMENRRIAVNRTRNAASKGDPIAGSLVNLEMSANMFFLGIDEDEDDSDMCMYP